MIRRISLIILLASSICVASDSLATQRWLDLMYYEKSEGGYVSAADSPEFFLTPDGKYSPESEYKESLARARNQDFEFKRKFPLRYKHIAIENNLPYQPVVTVNSSIESVIMAFPNRFMGNPASMFGHLFIVLKSKNGLAGSDLIHFLAETNGTDPNAYIYNGLVGKFKGKFLVEPFYKKIKDYYDVEDREVVYYTLTMSSAQLEDLQLHLIELKNTFFYYYFLDENCAYFTGKLLNIATGKQILTKSALLFPSQVINSLNSQGLLDEEWRRIPSSTLFNRSWNRLNSSQRDDVMNLYTSANETVTTHSETLRSFLLISDYLINNSPNLAQTIRHNRLLAYRMLGPTESKTLRPQLSKTSAIAPIVSNRVGWSVNNLSQKSFHYDPICYGEIDRIHELERKSVNYLGVNAVFPNMQPLMGYLELAKVENIPVWTPIRPEISWRINSQIGMRTHLFSNQSIEFGQTIGLGMNSLALGMIGLDITNFDPVLQQEWTDTIVRPTLSFQVRHQLVPNTVAATLRYEYRYDDSRYIGDFEFYIFGALATAQAIRNSNSDVYRASLATFF